MEAAATIAGKYTLVRKVGASAIAEVFLARFTGKDGKVDQVLLRRVLPDLARNEQFSQLFQKVTDVMSGLQHPNVLRILEVGDDPAANGRFTITEFIQGQNLRRVQEAARRKGGLHLAHALGIVQDLARGLHYAHERKDANGYSIGIVHGDVAPGNVILGYDGVARIQDFGMVWVEAAVPATDPTLLIEKFPYMSPERVCGAPLDRRSDLFSLALVLYEFVTGIPAFQAANPKELMARIVDCKPALPSAVKEGFPPELEKMLMRAMARVPDERYPTCEAFAVAIQEVMDRRNLSTSPALLGSYLRGLFGAGAVAEPAPSAARKPEAAAQVAKKIVETVSTPEKKAAREQEALVLADAPPVAPKTKVPLPPPAREPLRPTPSRPPWNAELEQQKVEITQAKVAAAEKQAAAKKEVDAAAAAKAAAEAAAAKEATQQAEDLIERRQSIDREAKARREAEAEMRTQLDRAIAARKEAEEKAEAAAEREAQARREVDELTEREAAAKRTVEEALAREAAAKKAVEDANAAEFGAKAIAEEAGRSETAAKKTADELAKRESAAKKSYDREAAARKAAEEGAAKDAAARKEAEERAETLVKELATSREATKVARKKADDTARQMAALNREFAEKRQAAVSEREEALRIELNASVERETVSRKDAETAVEKEVAATAALDAARVSEASAKKAAQEAERRESSLQKVYADLLERLEMAEQAAETARHDANRQVAEAKGAITVGLAGQREVEAARAEAEAARKDAAAARLEAEASRREISSAARESEAAKRAAGTVRKKWESAEKEKTDLQAQLEAARRDVEAARRDGAEARKEQEPLRQNADQVRRQTEAARRLADAATLEAEAAKQVAEAATQEAEAARRESEVHLQEAVGAREETEALRRELESLRQDMEILRAESEAARQEADVVRVAGDAARVEAETIRQEAEAIREQAEVARQEAESARLEAIAAAGAVSTEPAENGNGSRIGVSHVSMYLSALADAPRTNLTTDPGNFIGREEAILSLDLLLKGEQPVLTLTGNDGSGRTRLARRFASTKLVELSQEGGAWYVDLSAVRDAEGVCHAVATALSVALVPAFGELETVKHVGAAIGGRGRLLLVLDGVDGVADTLVRVLEEWVHAAPSARFLLAGRAPIGFEGERTRAIGALGLPTPASPIESEAMALFVTRARERRRQQGAGAEAGLPVIAKIVKLLEGNSLAIELVAARADVAAPTKLHADLAKALERDENSKSGNVLARVLEWVWQQLTPPEQDALGHCALFHGAFGAEAAEDVIDLSRHSPAPPEHEVLRSLRARGLVGGEDLHLEMHPSIRLFSLRKLDASGQIDAAATRHAARTLRVGRSASKDLERTGSRDALRRLQLETGNLLAVLERSLAITPPTATSATQALEAVQCLSPAVEAAGPFELGVGWMDAALGAAGKLPVDKRLRAEILLGRGRLRRSRGDVKGSTGDLYDAHDIAAVGDDRAFESAVLTEVGLTLQAKGKQDEGKKAHEQALNLARLVKDDRREGQALFHLALLHDVAGRVTDSQTAFQEAAAAFARCGARRSEGAVFAYFGASLQQHGDFDAARGVLEKALAIHQEVRDRALEGATVGRLASVAMEVAQHDAARELFVRAIQLQQERGDRRAEAALRGHLGILEHLDGKVEEARTSFVKAIWMLGDLGDLHVEGLYLAFLAGLVSSLGTLDTGAESFDLAKKQLTVANDAGGLEALELLTGFFDVEKARQGGDRAAAEAVRSAAARRAEKASSNGAAPEFVRLASRLVKEMLATDPGGRAVSRAPAQGRA